MEELRFSRYKDPHAQNQRFLRKWNTVLRTKYDGNLFMTQEQIAQVSEWCVDQFGEADLVRWDQWFDFFGFESDDDVLRFLIRWG